MPLLTGTLLGPWLDGTAPAGHEFGRHCTSLQGLTAQGFCGCCGGLCHDGVPAAPAQVTLLREYVQGVNEMMFVLPSGAFDPKRHSGGMAAAQAELSEEVTHETVAFFDPWMT